MTLHEWGEAVTVESTAMTLEADLDGFRHELALYRGVADLPRAVLPFIRDGIARREPVLVAMVPQRLDLLERTLGPDATRVDFVDMAELGANPACIIPEWRRFLEDTRDLGPVRGVGESLWAGRRDVEVAEAELHDSLLDLAFGDGVPWRLLCPYDVSALPDEVVDRAQRSHAKATPSAPPGFTELLAEPPAHATRVAFHHGDLAALRQRIRDLADGAGLGRAVRDNLVLAMHELAANSVLHAGGGGVLSFWREPDALVVEVRDRGRIDDPLVGQGTLDLDAESGRGIWIANQLCDLVQVRSGLEGTQVRLWTWLDPVSAA